MLLLKNGTFIDWQTLEFQHSDILIEEGSQGTIILNPHSSQTINAEVIDCKGNYITRAFACGHHHAYSALARGMGAPKKNPQNFLEILKYIWWTLDKALDPEMVYYSGLATAIACAKNGITFVIDHHASPFTVKGSLELLAKAFEEVGVGHLLCYEISDRDGIGIADKGLEETSEYLSLHKGLVGLHASFTVGDDTLKKAVSLAEKLDSGIHIHVAEAASDQEHCIQTYGKRVVERLADAGALQFAKTILAHCIHIDDRERGLIEGSPAWVVHNPDSNLNNGVGFFDSRGLGKRIMLGTDGMHSNMLQSAKTAFFAGHNFDAIDYPETYRRFRNAHKYLESNGFNQPKNDVIILDYDTPTPFRKDNFLGHFLFGLEPGHIRHVISHGKLIVSDRKILNVNEQEILLQAGKQAEKLWKKMQE